MITDPPCEAPAPFAGLATPGDPLPCWAQPGVTDSAAARRFLDELARADTLSLPAADGDRGYNIGRLVHRARGHGAAGLGSALVATAPDDDLARYHLELGLGPRRRFWPERVGREELATEALSDRRLLAQLERAGLSRAFVTFKSAAATRLVERLGLELCWTTAASSRTQEAANDKLSFAEAAQRYGFPALPARPASSVDAAHAAWSQLAPLFDAGCLLRHRRAAGGGAFRIVRTRRQLERAWNRLGAGPETIVFPFLPADRIRRHVSTHGLITGGRFAPFFFSDQLVDGARYRGGRTGSDWSPELVREITAAHRGMARWLTDLGYREAPAGFDGFLVDAGNRVRYVAFDPNIRATGTTMPWTAVAALGAQANRRFLWQVESFRIAGLRPSLALLRRRLGADLCDPRRLGDGGVLPSIVWPGLRFGPLAAWWLRAIFLAHDESHLRHLRRRIAALGTVV